MAEAQLYKSNGEEAGPIDVAASLFKAEVTDKRRTVVREVYNAYRTNQRQGTHATKTRGLVSGGGRKPWKQKGTGRARQGSIRAPQWRGGAIVHGPLPKEYREKVNRRKRQIAFRTVLASKFDANVIRFVETIDLEGPKTRHVVALRESLKATGKTLIVTAGKDEALARAARNLESSATHPTRVRPVVSISIADLLHADTLILTVEALRALEERLA